VSIRGRGATAYGVLWTVLLLPARLIEEGLHLLAALPFAEAVSVRLEPGVGTAETRVQYREGTPRWAVWIAHVAPEVVAAISGVAVIAWWVAGNPLPWPTTMLDWVLLWLLGVQFLAIAMPEQGGAP